MFSSPIRPTFSDILVEAKDPLYIYSVPAYVGLIRLATLAGRLPLSLALASLIPREAAIVQHLFGHEEIRLVRPECHTLQKCNVLVTLSPYGKVSIYDRSMETPADEREIVAGMCIPAWLLDRVADECALEELLEEQERQRLNEMLGKWETAGLVSEKIDQIINKVSRIANVFMYIGRHIYSKSDIGSNTLIREGLLQALKGRPVMSWSAEERLCVAAMHILFLTGRPIALEEFNGKQLTAVPLRKWLEKKLRLYSTMLGEPLSEHLHVQSLSDIAMQINSLSARMSHSPWVSFRRINGITLTKEECFDTSGDMQRSPMTLPPLLIDFAVRALGLDLPPAMSMEQQIGNRQPSRKCPYHDRPDTPMAVQQQVKLMTRAALQQDRATSSTNCVEQMLEALVLSTVLEADADYGMSSSIRNPSRLRDSDETRGSGVFSLAKDDFFCCVLPHPQLAEIMTTAELNQILYSSGLRMQFNRWHFIPGNFPPADVPANRHYYMPPQTSDIAEWSDLRHAGHVAAGVRYALRAPGPSHWQEPLTAFGYAYRGFYDIRLVRRNGPPFEKSEIRVAHHHLALLDIFWRTVLAFIEQEDHTWPIVQAYTRDWYINQKWQKALHERLGTIYPATLAVFGKAEHQREDLPCEYSALQTYDAGSTFSSSSVIVASIPTLEEKDCEYTHHSVR